MQDSKERFSNRVEDYARYRPGYPQAIIGFLQQQYDLPINKQIADIGAGTGISSELFLQAGYAVTAVEPNAEMRKKSIELLGNYSRFKSIGGSAEHTELGNKSVDGVICGQAFHWFDVVQAKAEFRRILKDEGIVVLIWNERKTGSDFEKEYDQLILKHARDYVQVNHRNINLEHIADFFSPEKCRLEIFQNSQVFNYAELEGRLLSSSYMPSRNEAGYNEMTADLNILFNRYKINDQVTIYYDTKVYVGRV